MLLKKQRHHITIKLTTAALLGAIAIGSASLSTPALANSGQTCGQYGSPDLFVKDIGAKVINIITNKSVTAEQSAERFRGILHTAFDVKYIARFVLGRNWNQANETQRAEYNRLFEEMLLDMYQVRFQNYSGESLIVDNSKVVSDTDSIVYGKIQKTDGSPPVNLEWRVRQKDSSCKIIDMLVEGVSMSLTHRSEFNSIIQQKNKGIDGLLQELRTKYANN
ncbi:MAG: ABC transporter substrate-binding protein [Alphaproteobacteria bacterium]|jgi:phospholipid transport system substrate-binding protein|nr:ABC transporter substrate-binding protein [Alphaproteobacteria bacterium]